MVTAQWGKYFLLLNNVTFGWEQQKTSSGQCQWLLEIATLIILFCSIFPELGGITICWLNISTTSSLCPVILKPLVVWVFLFSELLLVICGLFLLVHNTFTTFLIFLKPITLKGLLLKVKVNYTKIQCSSMLCIFQKLKIIKWEKQSKWVFLLFIQKLIWKNV